VHRLHILGARQILRHLDDVIDRIKDALAACWARATSGESDSARWQYGYIVVGAGILLIPEWLWL